jgi:Protein of unknown function (DUF2950)
MLNCCRCRRNGTIAVRSGQRSAPNIRSSIRAERERFVAAYDAKHSLQMDGDAEVTLIAGNDDWPMPIPIVKKANGWVFDSAAGEQEILARRIGRNELDAIQACLAFIDMQRDYAEADRDGNGYLEYARRWISSPGKHDGLYWPTKEGEPPSPGGPQLAEASTQYKARRIRRRITATCTGSLPRRERTRRAARATISFRAG